MSSLVLSIVYVLYNIVVSGFNKILAQYFIICILRWINIGTRPSSPYICTNCSINILECEYHFLLVCPKYRDLRITFFPLYYNCHWPTYHKFESLLCQNSKLVQEQIAKYIYHAHKLRNLTNL